MAPNAVILGVMGFIFTILGGMFWLFQRETALQCAETRAQMLSRITDLEYHGEYNDWRGQYDVY